MTGAFPVEIKSVQQHVRELDEDCQCSDEVRSESNTCSTCAFAMKRTGITGHKEEGRGEIISVEWFIYLFLSPIQYE